MISDYCTYYLCCSYAFLSSLLLAINTCIDCFGWVILEFNAATEMCERVNLNTDIQTYDMRARTYAHENNNKRANDAKRHIDICSRRICSHHCHQQCRKATICQCKLTDLKKTYSCKSKYIESGSIVALSFIKYIDAFHRGTFVMSSTFSLKKKIILKYLYFSYQDDEFSKNFDFFSKN